MSLKIIGKINIQSYIKSFDGLLSRSRDVANSLGGMQVYSISGYDNQGKFHQWYTPSRHAARAFEGPNNYAELESSAGAWFAGDVTEVGGTAQNGGSSLFGDVLGFVDKHFNGGLGYTGVAVNAYNKTPNVIKRDYAYELSKRTGWKSGRIFQNTKGFINGTGRYVSRLGPAGSVLSAAAITYDLLDDGNLRSSSILNGALLGVGLTFPVTAPFIIGYGILDYTFGIGDGIDRNFGTVNTGIYE